MRIAEELEQVKAALVEKEAKLKEVSEKMQASIVEQSAACEKLTAEKAELKAKLDDLLKANEKLDADHLAEAKKVAALMSQVKDLTGKLELTPFKDVTDGRAEAIAHGGEAGAIVDHVAVMESITDTKERIAYYRQHQTEIDAAFRK